MEFMEKSLEALKSLEKELDVLYKSYEAASVNLNMARGKPSTEQLDAMMPYMESALKQMGTHSQSGVDCRNYGELTGLSEMKAFFADYLNVKAENVLIGNHSSLSLMYDYLAQALVFKVPGADKAWRDLPSFSCICPSPGYDRHFALAEHLGAKLIQVDISQTSLDIPKIMELVKNDKSIKMLWLVPIYSNPTGHVLTEEDCHNLAKMEAAEDFRIFWDNAYAVHSLNGEKIVLPNMIELCEHYGHKNRIVEFASTSKISFAGSGISAMASSKENLDYFQSSLKFKTIGPNKMNQLLHLNFLECAGGVESIMKIHADYLAPKFQKVLDVFEEELGGTGLAKWSKPEGGYFISLQLLGVSAQAVVSECKRLGLTLTSAGAGFPYNKDKDDAYIRISPSFPTCDDVEKAMRLLSLVIKKQAVAQALELK